MIHSAIRRFLLLEDHHTRVVVLAVMAIGIAAGALGPFLSLRGKALLTDTFAHATLPGIAGAFLLAPLWDGDPRDPRILFLAAGGSGLLAMWAVEFLSRLPGVREDTALAVVLSVFFGAGAVLLSLVQRSPVGNAAGISNFLYGKAATLTSEDLRWAAAAASVSVLFVTLALKELRLWSFDPHFARSIGFRVALLDAVFAMLMAWVGVIALRAVGLVLLVALFIGPAAAARCWTTRLSTMVALSAAFGATSAWIGTLVSALGPRLPAGALVVLSSTALFLISARFGTLRRGQRSQIGA